MLKIEAARKQFCNCFVFITNSSIIYVFLLSNPYFDIGFLKIMKPELEYAFCEGNVNYIDFPSKD